MEKVSFDEVMKILSDGVWSNSACIGYAIIACQELNIDKKDIVRIVGQLNSAFDRVSIDDAKRKYSEF